MTQLLNSNEAAKFLRIKPQTLANWRHTRQKLNYIKVGRAIKYELSELERFVEDNKVVLNG